MDGVYVPKLKVFLSAEQRERLEEIVRNGRSPARKITHARVLLLSDEDHVEGGRSDEFIGKVLGLHRNSVYRTRARFVREGEVPALNRKPRLTPPTPPKLDGRGEAHLIQICCSAPPEGRARWTLNLLARELVNRRIVTSICMETVNKALKKTNCSPGRSIDSVSPKSPADTSSRGWRKSLTSTPSRRTRTSR
jgi:transposase